MRPISPKAAVPALTGRRRAAEAIASATARSAPGSSMRTPPATLTKTSAWPSGIPACRARTATIIARRFGSTPVATRLGIARSLCATSAWISRRIGRVPSSAHATAAPGSPSTVRPKTSDGSGTPTRPAPVISKTPSSFVEPNRFFDGAEHPVRAVAVALELQDAVDEVLEDARAGDRAVLRHVPDEDRRDAVRLRRRGAGGPRLRAPARRSRARSRGRRSRASAPSR